VAPVFAIVLGFFCSSFADLALVFVRYQPAGIFLQPVRVGAPVRAAIATVAHREGGDGLYCDKSKQQKTRS
jgi:hypothetical protein